MLAWIEWGKHLIIGKRKSPHCFKGVHKMPVEYQANTNA